MYQEFDEHFEPLTRTSEVRMRYDNRWENGERRTEGGGRRAEGAKTGCAPRHAGKWCRVHGLAVLAASRRESRREAPPRPGAVTSSLSILLDFVALLPRRGWDSVCVVAMTTIVTGRWCVHKSIRPRSCFFCGDDYVFANGVMRGTLLSFAKGLRTRDARLRQNDYFSLPRSLLQFCLPVLIRGEMLFNGERSRSVCLGNLEEMLLPLE